LLQKFLGIEKAKKEIEDGIKLSFKMVNEIDTAERGLLSNWKMKNIKRANNIRKNNQMLLYKSCIVKIISTNWLDLVKDVYVQNDPIKSTNSLALEIILKDENKKHCALNIVQQSSIFDYFKLLMFLGNFNVLGEDKVLFVISDEIEHKAKVLIKLKKFDIDVINLKE
jgi:hypothetical protein